ncbi:MAG: GNAT family N-acetyltransferase [Planctomycetes bacterium]|nr:GNAT family N-acetyltransferase [Planctomycetota bacterium]
MVSSITTNTLDIGTPMAAPAGEITCRIAENVDALDLADWHRVCDPDDALMDPRLLGAVQASAPKDNRFWYLTFYNTAQEPIAAACVSLFVIDGAMFAKPWARHLLGYTRCIFPRYLKFRVLFCGLPLSTGCSHLRLAPGADAGAVMTALDRELNKLRRQQRAWLVVAKEFDSDERGHADHLTGLGYLRVDSLPMNTFRHRYASFDAFLADVRSHYRYKINRSRKKFTKAGLKVEHLTDTDAILRLYTPELHQLYVDVVSKAEHKLEILSHQFFVELVRKFGSQVSLTVVRQGERIVAYGWGLKTGDTYRNLFVGIDYTLNDESDVYFNLMMHDLDYGLRQGACPLLVGQTSDVFKSRLGCQAEPRFVYIKATAWWLHWSIRATKDWFFPPFAPPPPRDLLKPADGVESSTGEESD